MVMGRGPTFAAYYGQIERLVWDRLNKESPEYLLQVDFDEYLDFLEGETRWEPLEWYEDLKTIEPFTEKVDRADTFDRRHYTKDVQRLRLRVPISSHPQRADYFKFGPSSLKLNGEPEWKFNGDVLVVEMDATEQDVKKAISNIRFWLGGRNKNIEEGNANLRNRIRVVWENRRKQLEEKYGQAQAVLEKLNIPLHQDPDAKAKPVEIKRRELRTVIERPKAQPARQEPALNREDVLALMDFIDQYVRQFEVAPETYVKMNEEKLRNLLVGMMNTNYPGSTTAETFSKLGKTDISMRVDSGHVLICECKFWRGAKAYAEALDQLFGYLTWRQNYGVLIHFCKLKDMTRAVSEAKRAMQEHPTFSRDSLHDQSDTRLVTRHSHPQDAEKSVEVYHLFVDLST